jgi:hypothetical protein
MKRRQILLSVATNAAACGARFATHSIRPAYLEPTGPIYGSSAGKRTLSQSCLDAQHNRLPQAAADESASQISIAVGDGLP